MKSEMNISGIERLKKQHKKTDSRNDMRNYQAHNTAHNDIHKIASRFFYNSTAKNRALLAL